MFSFVYAAIYTAFRWTLTLELAKFRVLCAAPVVIRLRTPLISFCAVLQRTLCTACSLATPFLFQLWSMPWEFAQLLGLQNLPPCSHQAEGSGNNTSGHQCSWSPTIDHKLCNKALSKTCAKLWHALLKKLWVTNCIYETWEVEAAHCLQLRSKINFWPFVLGVRSRFYVFLLVLLRMKLRFLSYTRFRDNFASYDSAVPFEWNVPSPLETILQTTRLEFLTRIAKCKRSPRTSSLFL